jgi:hypothetical protein
VRRDGGRRGDGINTVNVFAIVTYVYLRSRCTNSFKNRVFTQVAAGHVVSHLGKRDCNCTHTWSTNTDDVKAVRNRKIKRRGRHHD